MPSYKVIELIGTSYKSWEDAANTVLEEASKTLRGIRVAEITKMDVRMHEKGRLLYRTRLKVSFEVGSLEEFGKVFGPAPAIDEEQY